MIGEVGTRSFYQPLAALFADDDRTVRRSALLAAGRVGHPRLLPPVIDNLAAPATRSAAMAALHGFGEELLPLASEALAGESPYAEEARTRQLGKLFDVEITEHPVRETAAWALHKLDPARFECHAGDLARDENLQVARLAASLTA